MNQQAIFSSNLPPANYQQYRDSHYNSNPPGVQVYVNSQSNGVDNGRYNVWDTISKFHTREQKLEEVRKTCESIKSYVSEKIGPTDDVNEHYPMLKTYSADLIKHIKALDEFGQLNQEVKTERNGNRLEPTAAQGNYPSHSPSNAARSPYPVHNPPPQQSFPPQNYSPADYSMDYPPPMMGGNNQGKGNFQGPSSAGTPTGPTPPISQDNPFMELVWSSGDQKKRSSGQMRKKRKLDEEDRG